MLLCFSPKWASLSKDKQGLSPTTRFLNENDSLAYFAILGELSSGLSFTVGYFKTFSFLSLLVGQGRISPYKFLVPCLSVRVKFTNQ